MGTLALVASVPLFAWGVTFLYVFFQPLDRPMFLDEVRRIQVAAILVAVVVASIGFVDLSSTFGPRYW